MFVTRISGSSRLFFFSFFLFKVYIVLGRAVPEGNTVYVMVQELNRYGEPRTTAIWKPSTGEGFNARDSRYACQPKSRMIMHSIMKIT